VTIVLGLTGSIATGKSTVLEMFGELGALVRSADRTVHMLYAGRAAAAVEAKFPGTVVNGAVDRVRLAKTLLEAPDRFPELEAIIHPMVREETNAFLEEAKAVGHSVVVLEVPLLFETGAPYPLDATVVTWCDAQIQRKRALARSGMTVEKLEAILARQIGQDEKMKRADYRIDTGRGFWRTRAQVADILKDCRQRQTKKERSE